MASLITLGGMEQGTAAGLATGTAGARYFDRIVGSAADVEVIAGAALSGSYGLRLSPSGSMAHAGWQNSGASGILGASGTLVGGFRARFITLPTADFPIFIDIGTAGGNDALLWFDNATDKVRADFGGNAQLGPLLVANTSFWVDFRIIHNANPHTFEWQIDGVAQTTVNLAVASENIFIAGFGSDNSNQTGSLDIDDFMLSLTSADYPLGPHKAVLLTADTGGTTAEIGTANATGRMVTNSAIDATHNSAQILTAVSEVPPLLGGTATGLGQRTSGTGNACGIPMTTYTLVGGETITGVRSVICMWAANATAAANTFGHRIFNGTTEQILTAAAAYQGQNTTTPAWNCKVATPANFDTQAELDAMVMRLGYSGDIAPLPGVHAVYAEVAIKLSTSTPIGKDLSLSWDTRAALGDTLALSWNTLAILGDTLALSWDARDIVGDILDTSWSIRTAIGDILDTTWHISAALGDTLALSWDTRAALGDQLALIWDARGMLGDDLALLWDLRDIIGDAVVLSWDLRSLIADEVALVWDVEAIGAVGKELSLSWDARAILGDELSLSYNVLAALGDTLSVVWDIRAALGDTLALSWDDRALLADTLSLSWDVRSTIGNTAVLIWDVRASLPDSIALVWDVRSSAGDEVALVWDVESIALLVSKDLSLTWDLRVAIGDQAQLVWDTRETSGDDLVVVWGIRTMAGNAVVLSWHVRSVVGDVLATAWDIRSAAGDDLTLQWNISSSIDSELVVVWSVESDDTPPVIHYLLTTSVPDRWRLWVHHRNNGVPNRWKKDVPNRWRTEVRG